MEKVKAFLAFVFIWFTELLKLRVIVVAVLSPLIVLASYDAIVSGAAPDVAELLKASFTPVASLVIELVALVLGLYVVFVVSLVLDHLFYDESRPVTNIFEENLLIPYLASFFLFTMFYIGGMPGSGEVTWWLKCYFCLQVLLAILLAGRGDELGCDARAPSRFFGNKKVYRTLAFVEYVVVCVLLLFS